MCKLYKSQMDKFKDLDIKEIQKIEKLVKSYDCVKFEHRQQYLNLFSITIDDLLGIDNTND